MTWPPNSFAEALLAAFAFGLVGTVLTLLGFKLFDWITPGIKLEYELAEKHNLAVAIVTGSIIIGIAMIMVAAMG